MSLIKIKTQRQASTINIQVSSIVTQTLHLTFPTFHIPFPHYLHTTSTSPLSCKKTITKTCNFITVLIARNQYIYIYIYIIPRICQRGMSGVEFRRTVVGRSGHHTHLHLQVDRPHHHGDR